MLRDVVMFAALTVAVGACTVEDVKDTRQADSLAALSSKTAPSPAPASAATGTGASASAPSTSSASPNAPPPNDAAGSSASGATSPADAQAAGTPSAASGNLAPDSVDVGRRNKGALVPQSRLRLEVDLNAKQLTAYDGDQRIATYRVAVGSSQWPTQTGQWEVKQVVWNPEWIPPKDEAWAEAKDPKAPGAPDNPLGRAQLVYDPPRTVHGTNEPSSIGKAVSHGSIRMANADIVQLARRVMEMAGAPKDDSFYQRAAQNRTEKIVVDLPQRVPIRVF
jgi:lipoprotein-anchoring transpeptidase ErfK/SrfK